MMKLRINGETKDFPAYEGETCSMTVEALLGELGLKRPGVTLRGMAVELNREIVPRSLYSETTLTDGDSLELVRMTGGG